MGKSKGLFDAKKIDAKGDCRLTATGRTLTYLATKELLGQSSGTTDDKMICTLFNPSTINH